MNRELSKTTRELSRRASSRVVSPGRFSEESCASPDKTLFVPPDFSETVSRRLSEPLAPAPEPRSESPRSECFVGSYVGCFGSGARNTTPREAFADAAVPPARKLAGPPTLPPPTLPPPTLPPPPLPPATLPPPPLPRLLLRLPLRLLPPREPLLVAPPPAARIAAARASARRASAGMKSGMASSRTTRTSFLSRLGSYSRRTRAPAGTRPLPKSSLRSVNTLSANASAVFGSHAPACRAAYPGSLSVSSVCSLRTKPSSSRKPTSIRRTPTAKLCAHHFNSLSRSKRATCACASITRVVFNSTYPGKPAFSPSQQSTSPPSTSLCLPTPARTTAQNASAQSTGSAYLLAPPVHASSNEKPQ